jgi:hypothetical protein
MICAFSARSNGCHVNSANRLGRAARFLEDRYASDAVQALRRPRFLIAPRVASTSLGEVSKLGDKRA